MLREERLRFVLGSWDDLWLSSKQWRGKEAHSGDGEIIWIICQLLNNKVCSRAHCCYIALIERTLRISSLLGIWMGIICLVFLLVGCVLGCQQLRWWYWWRKGWEPWPRADLSEHPVPEGDYLQHPLPAVADEAEAEGTQVRLLIMLSSMFFR